MTPPKPVFVLALLVVLVASLAAASSYIAAAAGDGTRPTVSLTSPGKHAPGAYTSIDATVPIQASASDDVGVKSVDFYAGSIHLGTDTSAPYQASFDTAVWPNWQTSFIKVVAKDAAGNSAEDLIYVQVVRAKSIPVPDTTAPTISLTRPARAIGNGNTTIDGVVALEATATDNIGVQSVDFYAGSLHLGTDTSAPYQASFNTSSWPNGQTSALIVVAKDGAGNKAEDRISIQLVRANSPSTPVPTTPTNGASADRISPTVSVTRPARPAPGAYTSIDGLVPLEASASDNIAVQAVDFYAGSTLVSTDTSPPYQATFNSSGWPSGQTSFIKAVAKDAAGNRAENLVYVKVVRGATASSPLPAACADTKDNDGDGKTDFPADPGCSSTTDTDESNPVTKPAISIADTDATTPSGAKLTWTPPPLTNPTTVTVPDSGPRTIQLDPARDYVLKLGHRQGSGIELMGGRNVVLIGGRITAPDVSSSSNVDAARCFVITDNVGVVHIEGVLAENCATGVAIRAPQSTVQLQNVRFTDVDSPWELNHPDVIQTWKGPKEIRIDGLTADFSSKGFLWMSVDGTWPQRIDQRRVNFRLWSKGGATSNGPHHYTWHTNSSTRSTCQDCWVETGWWENVYRRRLQDGWDGFDKPGGGWEFLPYRVVGRDGRSVDVETKAEHDAMANDDLGRRQGDYMERIATPSLVGERWSWGVPGGGDFVPAGAVGLGYATPGYT